MKTVLATTYAVNPYKGSEDAMGWNYVYQIARFHKVIAITRENNRPAIEAYMDQNPDAVYDNIRFLYFDLPRRWRFWKKGSRGAMLYFLLWQRGVINFVKQHDIQFDITHHLNFHNDWTPSFLWRLKKPFVWGPIGHHPFIPSIFQERIPWGMRLRNAVTWGVKNYFWKFNMNLKTTKRKASHIWCMNDSVPKVLGLTENDYHISPSVATQDFGWNSEQDTGTLHVISAGRLVHMKGFDLTIRSFALFVKLHPEIRAKLTIVGDGPERQNLLEMIESLGVGEQVEMISWIERSDLMQKMKEASIFLFPSHEGAGMVVPEALSFGLPVLTIENCGPGQFVESAYGKVVPTASYASTVTLLAEGLFELFSDKERYQKMRKAARVAFEERFHWDRRGEALRGIYSKL